MVMAQVVSQAGNLEQVTFEIQTAYRPPPRLRHPVLTARSGSVYDGSRTTDLETRTVQVINTVPDMPSTLQRRGSCCFPSGNLKHCLQTKGIPGGVSVFIIIEVAVNGTPLCRPAGEITGPAG